MATRAEPDRRDRRLDAEIRRLAVPAALALATEPLYELCDTAILGRIGAAQLGGAALAVRILAFGHAVFVFLMFGTTAAVARRRGAGDERGAAEQGVTAMWLALGSGLAATAVLLVSGRTLLGWFGASPAVEGYAWTYLWISLAGLPAHTMVMAGVGHQRGHHNTQRPLLVSAATVALNLVLELWLVLGLGYGVGASALGTVIAKWLGAGAYLVFLRQDRRRTGASRWPSRASLRGQLVVGRDLVARTSLLLAVFTAAQALAARTGDDGLAGYAIAFQVWMFGVYALDGLEAAGQTMVAHRLGAGSGDEVRAVVARLLRWGAVLGVGLGVLLAVTAPALPRLVTDDAAAVAAATTSLWWVAAMQPVNAVAFALDGILVGAGRQRYLAGAMAVAAVVFVVAVVTGGWAEGGLGAVWAALAAFMAVRFATGWIAARPSSGVRIT